MTPRTLGRSGVALASVLFATSALAVGICSPSAEAATPTPLPQTTLRSALVQWLSVSPAYRRTGTVAAVASQFNCMSDCLGLWVSHDGGSTWHRAASRNWQPGRLFIAVGTDGRESFIGAGSHSVARSDDAGETWHDVGLGGMPTALPSFAQDNGVIVAAAGSAPSSYVLRKGTPENVGGSDGAAQDMAFYVAPSFPNTGRFSPALLAAYDPKSKLPEVFHCTADFACGRPTLLSETGTPSSMTSAATALYAPDDYAALGTVFADTPVGVQKSTDGGVTFSPLAVAPTQGAVATTTPMMALAPGYSEAGPVRTAYVAVFQAFDIQSKSARTGGGIYSTTDGGASWAPLATSGLFTGGAVAVAAAPDGRLFAGYFQGRTSGGLACSVDEGKSWAASCPPVTHESSGAGADGSARACSDGCTAGSTGGGPNAAGSNGGTDGGNAAGAPPSLTPAGAQTPTSSGKVGAMVPWGLAAALVLGLLAFLRSRWSRRRMT
jgi:hypothetical protein